MASGLEQGPRWIFEGKGEDGAGALLRTEGMWGPRERRSPLHLCWWGRLALLSLCGEWVRQHTDAVSYRQEIGARPDTRGSGDVS